MTYRVFPLVFIIIIAGCAGFGNPDDIRIDNERDSPAQVRIYVNDSPGNVEFRADKRMNSSEAIEFDDELQPNHDYSITLFVNGTKYQQDYHHLDDTAIWIDIRESEVDFTEVHMD